MGLTNVILLSQAAGYSVTIILSLCVVIPMIMHEASFQGHCLLFTKGSFISENGSFDPDWGSSFYCGFTTVVGFLSFFISLIQLVRICIFLCKSTESSFLAAFLDTVVALFMSLLVITSAYFVTRGFSTWCSAITERFPQCETSEVMEIKGCPDINPRGFFLEMGTVQFAIWTALVFWVVLFVLAARKVFVFHERENIIISMARERMRYAGPSYDSYD
jgi:hypothetical protein